MAYVEEKEEIVESGHQKVYSSILVKAVDKFDQVKKTKGESFLLYNFPQKKGHAFLIVFYRKFTALNFPVPQ